MFAFHVNDWWLQYAINLGQLLHFCFLLPCPDRWWCRKRIIFSNSWWFICIFERSIVCFCFSFGFWWEKVFEESWSLCIFFASTAGALLLSIVCVYFCVTYLADILIPLQITLIKIVLSSFHDQGWNFESLHKSTSQ